MKKAPGSFLIFGTTVTVIMGAILAWIWQALPPKIPLFYSLPWGEEQLADKVYLVYVLIGCLVLLAITRMFSLWAGRDDDTVEITIMAGGVTAVMLIAATFFRIIQIFIGT